MFRLVTFGSLSLVRDSGEVLELPRRRLALLAILASAGERGVTRDSLVGFLWPEASSERARHSLEQLLYTLRVQLTDDAFQGTDPIRLNGNIVASDVADLERAFAKGDNDSIAHLYRGAFLDGVYLNGADKFERWSEDERTRYRTLYIDSLEHLANDCSAHEAHTAAVGWWRKLVAVEPLGKRGAIGLMRALAAAGDRAGALQHARLHEVMLRDELDVPVDPDVIALARELKNVDQQESVVTARTAVGSEEILHEGSRVAVATIAPPPGDGRSVELRSRRVWWIGAAVAVLLVVAGVLGSRLRPDVAPQHNRIAVLPYRNLGKPNDSLFAEGLADEIANRIAGLPGITLIGRQSVLRYKNSAKSAKEIGNEISVDYVLGGSVQWILSPGTPRRMRVQSELLRASDNSVVWAHPDEAEFTDDIFRLQDDIAARVLRSLNIAHEVAEQRLRRRVPTRNIEAYQLFQIARLQASLRTGASIERAIMNYGKAIALDSTYAEAYAGLANAWVVYPTFWSRTDSTLNMVPSARDAYARAERFARQALALDSTIVEADMALAYTGLMATADHERAVSSLEAVVRRDPDNATAHYYLRNALVAAGKYRAALVESRQGVELDPYSPLGNTLYGVDLTALGDTAKGMAALRRAIEVNEKFSQAYLILGSLLLAEGDRTGGADSVRAFLVRRGYPARASDAVAAALDGRASVPDAVQAVGALVQAEWEPEPRLAGVYALLGAKDRALGVLEAAANHHVGEMVFQHHQPFFASLKGNPRFEALWSKNSW